MKKKLLSLVLCLSMVGMLFTGCAGSSTEEASQSTEESGETSEETAGEATEDTAATEPVELDLFIDFSWYAGDNWEGIIPDAITEATGVKLNIIRTADDSQLGLLIASGELPDIVWTSNEIDRLSSSNLCMSFDDLIKQYNIDWEPSSDRQAIAKSHNSDSGDEHYYTILQNYNSPEEWSNASGGVPSIAGTYYRKDIWEALGSPEMNTIDQIYSVMKMVKEKYPEMKVLSAGNPTFRLSTIANWYGASYDFLYQEDGSVMYRDTTDKFYNYAKMANQMFRDGFYNEESLAISVDSDAQQEAANGKCFMYDWTFRPTKITELNTQSQSVNPDAEWAALSIPDDSAPITRSNSGWAGTFISNNCKNPEAAIKLIAYLNSEEGRHLSMWGREGIDYELDANGVPQFSDEWKEANADSNVASKIYNSNFFCTTELDEIYSYYSGVDQVIVDAFTRNSDKIVNYPELSIAKPNSSTDEGIILSKINEAREAELVKLYTAATEEEFENAYLDYMDLLNDLGVQTLNDYINTNVSTVKEKFGF